MICDELKDLIFLYAAGELEPAEADAVRGHLATGCPRCAGTMAEANAILASLPLSMPPVTPSESAKEELMMRIRTSANTPAGGHSSMPVDPTFAPAARGGRFSFGALATVSGLAAAIAAAVTGVAVWQNAGGKINGLIAERDILFAERMQMISLGVPEGKGPATGRVFWDLDRGKWRIVVFNLKPLPSGKVYQLWAIPDGAGAAPMPMDTFTVNAAGRATMTQSVPKSTTAMKVAAITEEPAGGSRTPTMPILLMGESTRERK